MKPTAWLLLGGPAHGEVHEVFLATKIVWEHKGRNYVYTPQVYNDEATGQSYVLGVWQPEPSELQFLLASRRPPPIVWDNSVASAGPKRIN